MLSAIFLTALLMQAPTAITSPPPTPDEVRSMLASADPKDQAWGAWWTSELRLTNMEPLLQKNLEAHVQGSDWQDESVLDSTLDAYIQTNSTPPPVELLASIYARRPTPAIILLSRVKPSEPADAFLLKQVHSEAERGESIEWFFVANVLLQHRTPGFVAAVLRDLRIKVDLRLCDSGPGCLPVGSGRTWSDGGSGGSGTPGFPPSVSYTPRSADAAFYEGESSVVAGPVLVMYVRRISPSHVPAPANGRMPGSVDPPRPFTSVRIVYVAAAVALKNGDSASGTRWSISDEGPSVIQWSTEAALIAQVERIRQDIRKRYTVMIQELRSSNLLSAEEASELALPNISINLADRRSVKTPLGNLNIH